MKQDVPGAVSSFILHTSSFAHFAIECSVDGGCKSQGGLNVVLRLVVAGFAAVGAVVLSVFCEPDAVIRMAKGAVPVARAAVFRLAADTTVKNLPWHGLILLPARERSGLNVPPAGLRQQWVAGQDCCSSAPTCAATQHHPEHSPIGIFSPIAQ
jgi:hypothetical protein